MKNFIKKKLPYALVFRDLVTSFFAGIFVLALRILPKRLFFEIKEHLSTVVRMDYETHDIFLYADSIAEYFLRKNSCKKEPETIEWIKTYIKPGDVVYDIGANVGAYSFVADRHTGGKAKIYSFEPSFSTFAQLVNNINLNSCQGRIIPLCVALFDETDLIVLNYSSLSPGAALHALGQPVDNHGQSFTPVFKQPTMSFRLDDLISLFKMESPTHIKLDVDGVEMEILRGAGKTLLDPGLRTILVEIEPALDRSVRIIEFLQEHNFRVDMVRSHGGNAMDTSNYLFVRV